MYVQLLTINLTLNPYYAERVANVRGEFIVPLKNQTS